MPRGQTSEVGSTLINVNGYHNTKTTSGWRLTHHLLAEEMLGRPLLPDEIVRFKDGDRRNLDKGNLEIIPRNTSSIRARIAVLQAKIDELTAEKEGLEHRLASELGAR